jgi:hypothetical protein
MDLRWRGRWYRDSLLDIFSLPIINGFESVGLAAKSACDTGDSRRIGMRTRG